MRALNTIKFVTEASVVFQQNLNRIEKAETYEEARDAANRAFGYLSAMGTFLNAMVCRENNEFTAYLDEVLEGWEADIYQKLAAISFQFGKEEESMKLLKKRDELRGSAE